MKRRKLVWVALLGIGIAWVVLWIASVRWAVFYQHRLDGSGSGPDFQTGISNGAFSFTFHPSRHFGMPERWTVGANSGPFRWGFKLWEPQDMPGMRATVIPLWSVAAMFLLPGVALAVRDRVWRRTVRPCPACGYSMVGLPAGARCPECGGGGSAST